MKLAERQRERFPYQESLELVVAIVIIVVTMVTIVIVINDDSPSLSSSQCDGSKLPPPLSLHETALYEWLNLPPNDP